MKQLRMGKIVYGALLSIGLMMPSSLYAENNRVVHYSVQEVQQKLLRKKMVKKSVFQEISHIYDACKQMVSRNSGAVVIGACIASVYAIVRLCRNKKRPMVSQEEPVRNSNELIFANLSREMREDDALREVPVPKVDYSKALLESIVSNDIDQVRNALDEAAAAVSRGDSSGNWERTAGGKLNLAATSCSVDIVDLLLQRCGDDSEPLGGYGYKTLDWIFQYGDNKQIVALFAWAELSIDSHTFLKDKTSWLYDLESPKKIGYQAVKDSVEARFACDDYKALHRALLVFFEQSGVSGMKDPLGVIMGYIEPQCDNEFVARLMQRDIKAFREKKNGHSVVDDINKLKRKKKSLIEQMGYMHDRKQQLACHSHANQLIEHLKALLGSDDMRNKYDMDRREEFYEQLARIEVQAETGASAYAYA